jgi:hypothetical protein
MSKRKFVPPVSSPPSLVVRAETLTISRSPDRRELVFTCEHTPEGQTRECIQCRARGRLDGLADVYLELWEIIQHAIAHGRSVPDEVMTEVAQRASDYVVRAPYEPPVRHDALVRAHDTTNARVTSRRGRPTG